MPRIYIDADACPVKSETYRVAERYGVPVCLVANTPLNVPDREWIECIVVVDHPEAADDWIVAHVTPDDVVISDDIPLASRCVSRGAQVLTPKGRIFTQHSVGEALATRNVLSHLRDQGLMGGGPAPFTSRDRSNFLQRLDQLVGASVRRSRDCATRPPDDTQAHP